MARRLPDRTAERILDEIIRDPDAPADGKLPGVRAISRLMGVSSTTVVNALSILEARNIVKKFHGKGCFVVDAEHHAAGPMYRNIGFVTPTTTAAECLMRLYESIERSCLERDLHVIMATCNSDYETEQSVIKRLQDAGCSGVVLYPVTRRRHQLANDYLNREFRDFPIVLVDIAFPEQNRSQVVFDNRRLGRAVTEALIRAGHRRIAFMQQDPISEVMHRSTTDRREGYDAALRAAGLSFHPSDIWPMPNTMDMMKEVDIWFSRWHTSSHRPSAVIAIDDNHAMHILHYAMAHGIRIPDDLVITGFDNMTFAQNTIPPLPTTDPDFHHAGEVAVDLLLQEIEGKAKGPINYVLPVGLTRFDRLPRRQPETASAPV